MNSRIFKTLEFHKIKELLYSHTITYLGKSFVEQLEPAIEIGIVKQMQSETIEAVSLLIRKGTFPLVEIPSVEASLKKVELGGFLNQKELLEIAQILRSSRNLKNYFHADVMDLSQIFLLTEYFKQLYTNKNVEEEIFRCIKSEEEMDDRASSELYQIRRKIMDAEGRIKEKLNSMIRSNNKFLQDAVVTFRNDRYVVPVKQEYKNEVPGFVHDFSSSGNTVFIEPTAVFNLNNEIKELKIKEQLEIERILALLTQLTENITEDISDTLSFIGKIDFAFAKAKYALSIDAYPPKLNEDGSIHLIKARHPLIPADKVVPIDIWIGDTFNTLIITGPNTGGKTVTLKTVGLLALMTQCGLHIPASEGSEISIFKNIFTDIGDEQSIEQSLSTFSSHMTNIVDIIQTIQEKDLVLLDELGSGTDPVEGAALAMSILEYLHNTNCISIATTHYSELKSFAIQTSGIENASCEFDVDTLRPTYKLLIGLPGRSNAFAISKKLGLSNTILKRAGDFLSKENIKFEDVLTDMERNRKHAKQERELSQKLLSEANLTKDKIEKEREILETKKAEILQKAKQEARDILRDAEEEANIIIKELNQLKKKKMENPTKKIEESRGKLKKSIAEIQKDLIQPKKVLTPIKESDLQVGMQVFIPSIDKTGNILSLPDKKGNVLIQAGLLKLTIHLSQIELISDTKVEEKKKTAINSFVHNKSQNISTEIKLLGLTVDEAVAELEKYLDDAYLANLPLIRVVHGKGSGALRNGIHQYLKKHPHVKSYRLGSFGEGDSGVTIVEFK